MTYRDMMLCLQFIAEEKVGASIREEGRREDAQHAANMAVVRGL